MGLIQHAADGRGPRPGAARMMRRICLVVAILPVLGLPLLTGGCTGAGGGVSVVGLRCEYLSDPMGVDVPHPRLSWLIASQRRGVSQSAYRILVASDPGKLRRNDGDLWDTGRRASPDAVNIPYDGEDLHSGTSYYWKVRIWDERDRGSAWSDAASFHTGMLEAGEWTGRWIAAADASISAPLLRTEFAVGQKVRRAVATVTGLGNYELYLNGSKVGDDVLAPAMTDYRKRVLYNTYDVTGLVTAGDNAVGITLGNGAYRLLSDPPRYGSVFRDHDLGPPCALLELDITLADGSRQRVVTDGSWLSAAGPVTFNSFYGGEDYDARLEQPGWSTPGFDPRGWRPVRVVPGPSGSLRSQMMPASRVIETIAPVTATRPAPGVYVFDLGRNVAGWWRLEVRGRAGVRIRIRGAETLNDAPFPQPLRPGDRISTDKPYHAEVWTTYTTAGRGAESWEPRFFYTGFRYLEATVDEPAAVRSLRVEGRVVHTDLGRTGRFTTSSPLLNRIHRAAVRTLVSNVHGYPTDNPHREKGGYTGDGQLVATSSMYDLDMAAFYTKWLRDMADAQEASGRIPNTAPPLVGGIGGGVAWGSAYILLPWWMHGTYGDRAVLAEHYPGMQRYLGYLERLARTDSDPEQPSIIDRFGDYWKSLGEWCAPGRGTGPNPPVVSTFYYYLDASVMARVARVLGRGDDAEEYGALADRVRRAFVSRFYDADTHLVGTHDEPFQTYQVLALTGELVPEGDRDAVLQTLVDDIVRTRKGHLDTGIVGTKYLWTVLAEGGRNDVAYGVATQTTYPGYGHWIRNGATTLWETWRGQTSHNQAMFATVEEYFYTHLAGIRPPGEDGTSAGYRRVAIRPEPPRGLEEVGASVVTVAGTVSSHWRQASESFRLEVRIPANSSGLISVPLRGLEGVVVREGTRTVWEEGGFRPGRNGVVNASSGAGSIAFEVASGRYVFTLTGHRREDPPEQG